VRQQPQRQTTQKRRRTIDDSEYSDIFEDDRVVSRKRPKTLLNESSSGFGGSEPVGMTTMSCSAVFFNEALESIQMDSELKNFFKLFLLAAQDPLDNPALKKLEDTFIQNVFAPKYLEHYDKYKSGSSQIWI
jgi:hypothetical protein